MSNKKLLEAQKTLQKNIQEKVTEKPKTDHTPKRVRRFPKVMSEEDLTKIVQCIDKSPRYNNKRAYNDFLKMRDSTLILFLFYTGLRPREALYLKWSDIDFKNRIITIDPFSNKERQAMPGILTLPACRCLEFYKKQYEEMNIPSEYLFPQVWNWKPLSSDGAGAMFREVCKEAKLDDVQFMKKDGKPKYKYGLYTFRRTFATKVYNSSNDIYAVSKLLRHTTLKAIPSYVIYSDEKRRDIADDVFK